MPYWGLPQSLSSSVGRAEDCRSAYLIINSPQVVGSIPASKIKSKKTRGFLAQLVRAFGC